MAQLFRNVDQEKSDMKLTLESGFSSEQAKAKLG